MNYRESQKVDNAIALLEEMRDTITTLESDKEKLEEREKELMDKVDGLSEERTQLLEEIDDLKQELREK